MKQRQWPFTYDEILADFFDAVECLEKCAARYFSGDHQADLDSLKAIITERAVTKVIFIGNTFNYFASQVAHQQYLECPQNLPFSVFCVELSEFYDYMLPLEPEPTLYIFISKSGQSRFLSASLDHLRLTKVDPELVWLITDNPEPPFSNILHHILPIHLGREVVMGTKSYFNSIFVIFLLFQALTGNYPFPEGLKTKFGSFIAALKGYRKNWEKSTQTIENYLSDFDYLYIIARDPASLGAAMLGALHAKTFTRLLTEGIYISNFFHGPFQILEKKIKPREIRIIMLVGEKVTNEATIYRLVKLINQRAGKVLVLSNNLAISATFRDNPSVLLVEFDAEIPVLSPIFEHFILQLVLLKIAKKRGLLRE